MKNIIAFGGRKESGKTELCKICVEHGFEIIYFAKPLKELCATIFNHSIDELNQLKNSKVSINFPNDKLELFSQLSGLPFDYCNKMLKNKVFSNSREIFQYIGTDVIRNYDNDWHANKTKELIINSTSNNICIDDLRFPNEKKILEDLNADLWFVIRPKFDNISNHISETSLTWHDFEYIIENDSDFQTLKERWNTYLENYNEMTEYRNFIYKQFNKVLKNTPIIPNFDEELISDVRNMFYPISRFTYYETKIDNDKIDYVMINENNNKTLNVKLKNNDIVTVNNLLVLEDLKKYL